MGCGETIMIEMILATGASGALGSSIANGQFVNLGAYLAADLDIQYFAGQAADFSIFRIAIVAALIGGLAILAGLAVLKRGALLISSTFMVGSAAVLELFWLGFLASPGAGLTILLQGVLGASAIIFLSASVRIARNHALLGGVMFAGSLVFLGIGLINFLGRADVGALMMPSLIGVGAFAFLLSILQSLRGDTGAQMILPGACLTLAALFVFATQGAGGLLGHALLAGGLLTGSLIAFAPKSLISGMMHNPHQETGLGMAYGDVKGKKQNKQPLNALGNVTGSVVRNNHDRQSLKSNKQAASKATQATLMANNPGDSGIERNYAASDAKNINRAQNAHAQSADKEHLTRNGVCAVNNGSKPQVSTDRLIEVLDFSGIAVWDWSLDSVYQSQSLCAMMGSDCEADFTPEAMRAFINPSHLSVFEKDILGHGADDGGFDVVVVLHNNEPMRIRGARAVDANGRLERVVAFFETVDKNVAGAVNANGGESSTLNGSALGVGAAALGGAATIGAGMLLHPDQDLTSSSYDKGASDKDVNSLMPVETKPIQNKNIALDTENNKHGQTLAEDKGATPLEASTSEIDTNGPYTNGSATTGIALSFQPMVGFGSGEVVGFEAKPAFASSETAHVTIDEVISKSAQFLASEHKKARSGDNHTQLSSDAFIAIGIGVEQLMAKGFVKSLQQSVKQNGLPFGTMVLEMSGLAAIGNVRATKSLFNELRQGGIRLAFADMDGDIGILGNLHRYDFEYIKIDRSIVANANDQYEAGQLSRTLVALGRDLGIRVFAAGIETPTQLKLMTELGCAYGVGDALLPSLQTNGIENSTHGHLKDKDYEPIEQRMASPFMEEANNNDPVMRKDGQSADYASNNGETVKSLDTLGTNALGAPAKKAALVGAALSAASLGKAPEKEAVVAFDQGAKDFNDIGKSSLLSQDADTSKTRYADGSEESPVSKQVEAKDALGDAKDVLRDESKGLHNLETAFANSVPSFDTEAKMDLGKDHDRSLQAASPRENSTLPKWRTWVNNLR